MSTLYAIPWIIPLVIVGTGNTVAHWFLIQRLRQAFPMVWVQLGSPARHPFFSTSFRHGWEEQKAGFRLILFIWTGRHVALHDGAITRLVWCARLASVLVVIFIALGSVNGTLGYHL